MGHQIRFYIVNEDEDNFLNYVNNMDDFIVDYKGKVVNVNGIKSSNRYVYYLAFNPLMDIRDKDGYINDEYGNIIEFSRSIKKHNNRIESGRLYVDLKYYDVTGNVVTKEKWLYNKFLVYKNWIIKNCRKSKEYNFFIGEETYKLYKSGEYKMMATPVTEVHFD
jgi:hypothetical protein